MQRSGRDKVFDKARVYFSHPHVIVLSYEEKVKALNTMISSPLVVVSGVSRNELVDWFNQNVGRSGFEKLTNDPLYTILANSNPKTVLTLCKTHPQISRLCRDDQVFENLLRLHFPDDFNIDDIPYKSQYKFLVGGGKVMIFGNNEEGQLGLGDFVDRNIPVMIPNLPVNIKQTSAGQGHTVLLDTDGKVWTFGGGEEGQLGLGEYINIDVPAMIPNLPVRIKQISAGGRHTILLDINGRVWTVGDGVFGQLGLGYNNDKNIPEMIHDLPVKIKQASGGGLHTILLDAEGRVWAFGQNNRGQLGLGDNVNRNTPVTIPNLPVEIKQVSGGSFHTVLLDVNGKVWTSGQLDLDDYDNHYISVPVTIPNLPVIKQVSAGGNHTILLDEEGKAWTFGHGMSGQLGLGGDTTDRKTPVRIPNLPVKIKQVSAGNNHTVILDTEGKAWTFGGGLSGQLGLGYNNDKNIPTMIPNLPVEIKQVATGANYTIIITTPNQ